MMMMNWRATEVIEPTASFAGFEDRKGRQYAEGTEILEEKGAENWAIFGWPL
jgi:hypothetical protein